MSGNANSIRAGRAFVELFADNTKLVRGLRAARTQLLAFGKDVRNQGLKVFAGGAAVTGAMAAAVRTFTDWGDSVAQASKRTGMTAEAFSTLAYAAQVSDVEVSRFEAGIRLMQRTLVKAAGGSKQAQGAFKTLGLDVGKLTRMSPDQQFVALADAIARVRNPAMKTALAMQIFGRGGVQLLPLLNGGAAGIREFAAEAQRLGLVISSKDASAAEYLDDVLKRMWLTIKKVAFDIGAVLAPVFEKMAMWVLRTAVTTSQWIKDHKPMVVLAFQIAVAVAAVGAALIAVGSIITGVGYALGVLASICAAVGGVWSAVAAVIGFLASPIGLVVAAVLSLGAVLLNVSGWGGQAAEWLRGCFETLAADAQATFRGIADALAAGDLALAAKVLWLGLQVEWKRGVNFISGIWWSFTALLATALADLWDGLRALCVREWNNLANLWDVGVFYLCGAWDGLLLAVSKVWGEMKAGAREAWNEIQALWSVGFDVAAANDAVEAEKDANNARRERTTGEAFAKRETDLAGRQAGREARLAGIGQDNLDTTGQIEADRRRKAEDAQTELDYLIQQRDDAIARARREAAAAGKGRRFREVKPPAFGGADLRAAEGRLIASGFNVLGGALLGFQRANVQEKIAAAAERTAGNTDRMKELMEDDEGAQFE